MTLREGQRVRLTGRAWGYASQNREVYAHLTFVDGGYVKIDEREVMVSGSMVNGYEFEVDAHHGDVRRLSTPRGFPLVEIPFRDYPSSTERTLEIQESSLVEPHLWVGPPVHEVQLGSNPDDLTHLERAHLNERAVRALHRALGDWLRGLDQDV